jgi:serine protease Do
LSALRTPAYVVAVEGTQAGVTVRPVFLGHGDRFGAARWGRPVLPLGGVAVAPGALLFSLAGEFLGCVVSEDGGLAVAGARDVLDAVERLGSGPSALPATAGVALQSLTPSLARATGAPHGVVVAEVDPRGPAAAVLRPADVILSVDDRPADTADRVLLDLAARPVGAVVSIAIVRMGEPLTVSVTLAAARAEAVQGGDSLLPGDVVLRAGNLADPTPAQLRRLLGQPDGPALVTVVVRRQGRQHVLALPAAGSNENRR